MRKQLSRSFAVALTAAAVFTASSASATIILYEGFDYGTGSVSGGNGTTLSVDGSPMNGGTGWSGAWVGRNAETNFANIVADSLSYSDGSIDLATAGNRFQVASFRDVSRDFDSALGEGTYYFSVLLGIGDSSGDERTRFRITQDGSQNGVFEVGFGYGGSPAASLVYRTGGDTPVTGAGTGISGTNFIVGKFDLSETGTMSNISVWLNPDDLSSEAANTPTVAIDPSIGGGAGGVRLTRTGGGTSGVFDEVRFGTTWDVVAVPEPSTYALFAGVLAALLVLRRRR